MTHATNTGIHEMTKQMTKSNAQSNAKARARSNETPTIVLKTIHDAIMRDNPSSTLTTKIMRVRLRATPAMQQIHTRNASWIFTQSQSDACRAMFDAKFATRQANASKRVAKTRAKANAQTPVTPNVENAE